MADLRQVRMSPDWWVDNMSPEEAKLLLEEEDTEGCFVVRKSSTTRLFTLSLYTKKPPARVVHYRIKKNTRGQFYLNVGYHHFDSIPDLVNYYKYISSGELVSKLITGPRGGRQRSPTADRRRDDWRINRGDLSFSRGLDCGAFGEVKQGTLHQTINVAVKMIREGQANMSDEEFIQEAQVMTELQHRNLVQLYGVCTERPIYLVMEYMEHGSLLEYLCRNRTSLRANLSRLLNMCIQVCEAMAYLESKNYIHRDLAARNCLVGSDYVVKVSDFGLARCAIRGDGLYVARGRRIFAPKWAPPEVFQQLLFSSKSDVWAYGVLMWEIFTCGNKPYGTQNATEVEAYVIAGNILPNPSGCPEEVYDVMRDCWCYTPVDRSDFRELKVQLTNVYQQVVSSTL